MEQRCCTRRFKAFILLMLAGIALTNCGQRKPAGVAQDVTVADTVNFDVFKDEINRIIANSPRELEIINFVNEMGSSYIFDLTLPLTEAEKFETQNEIALAWGAYTADLVYANTYNRYDIVPYVSDILNQLSQRLGVQDQFPKTVRLLERMSANENKSDSLSYYLNQVLTTSRQELESGEIPEVYALFSIGAGVESLYLLSQLTSYAKENQKMLAYLSERRDLGKSIFRLTEILASDETVKPYYEKIDRLNKYFESHPDFGEKELSEITFLIMEVRSQILSL
ncbi:MAG: hypothetical protein AB7V25_09020 [Mangrovibacterium sp.]